MSTSRSRGTDIALIGGFAALIAVCAILPAIQVSGAVPITLQTFAVLLTGAVLGPRRGALAVLLYLLVGFAGLPVFTQGQSGLGVLTKPSVGYLVSFPLMALVIGAIVVALPRRTIASNVPAIAIAAVLTSVLVNYPLGIAGLMWRADMSFEAAFTFNLTFWVGDLIKCVAVALVATSVHRAFPDLLGRRRPVARQPALQ